LTPPQRLARLRSASQRLHRPVAIRHPVDVVREAGPVQAQEPRAARLAFRARSRDLTAADVDRARTEERSLLRAWMMRKTVHLIATEDAGWLLPLFSPTIVRWSRKRLTDFGLDGRGQERALALLHRAVDEEGALTRPELAERLERAGFDTANEFKVHLWLLATLDGELCLGPDRGGQTCLVRTADWIGEPERRSREDSLAELARRYLRAYAPASERDLARWAGLPLRDARVGFEAIAAELEPAGDLQTLGGLPRASRSPVVRMLGAFDNYNLGYVDRDFAIAPEFAKRVNPGGGIVRPSIVVDGACVATWSSKRSGKRLAVSIEPFEPLAAEIEKAIAAEVADIGRFEGVDAATIPRR
jgi:hypothetical protein